MGWFRMVHVVEFPTECALSTLIPVASVTLQALHVIHKLIDSRTEQISLSSFSVMKHVACAQLRGAYGCWSSRLLKLWHNIIDPPHSILSY